MLSISAVAEKSIAVVLVHALNDLFAHTGFAVLLAEDRPSLYKLSSFCGIIKAHRSFSLSFLVFRRVKENQNDGGERQPGPACLLALPMQTLQKWAAKKAGREKYHARPLGSRIGWRENESRKARVNRSCGE